MTLPLRVQSEYMCTIYTNNCQVSCCFIPSAWCTLSFKLLYSCWKKLCHSRTVTLKIINIKYKVKIQHTCSQWTMAFASLLNVEIWIWITLWIVTPMSDLSQGLFCLAPGWQPSDVNHRQGCKCPMNPHLNPHRCSCRCLPLTVVVCIPNHIFFSFSFCGIFPLKYIYFKKLPLKFSVPRLHCCWTLQTDPPRWCL